jgi:hypothetical protein
LYRHRMTRIVWVSPTDGAEDAYEDL